MKLVPASMYTVPKIAALGAANELPAHTHAQSMEVAQKCCRWCGKVLVNPRRNQECCSAECREEWERSKRMRRKQTAADKPKGHCLWCEGDFEKVRQQQDFCCPEHQQAFNNFWKGMGPRLAKVMHAWRVGKVKGGLTDVCREFSAAREELKDKRAKAKTEAKTKGEKR
ncbi:MAG: hypothetical protein H7Y60_16880 [Rhodospirillaceae bacterium]|nr:hypothetical protein [Rhodospirillales bacterium]